MVAIFRNAVAAGLTLAGVFAAELLAFAGFAQLYLLALTENTSNLVEEIGLLVFLGYLLAVAASVPPTIALLLARVRTHGPYLFAGALSLPLGLGLAGVLLGVMDNAGAILVRAPDGTYHAPSFGSTLAMTSGAVVSLATQVADAGATAILVAAIVAALGAGWGWMTWGLVTRR